ncbi:hypothetical protein Goklo_005985 [Gossypium klotzschianum]|uniref:Uncharacterized protein n=1 Tax=Gossypium klotzschianum TaxID=34286 RepID=A0A7J8VFZ5_9ROSI|nr:hypothetical protein [Gossypium klotzschianum]
MVNLHNVGTFNVDTGFKAEEKIVTLVRTSISNLLLLKMLCETHI